VKSIKIIIMILAIIIVVMLSIVVVMQFNNNVDNNEITENKVNASSTNEQKGNKSIDYSTFYTVLNCVQKYVTYSSVDVNEKTTITEEGYVNSSTAEDLGITSEEIKKNVVYQMLDIEYIQQNNIKVNFYNNLLKFIPKQMTGIEKGNISKYVAYGELVEISTMKKIGNQYFLITLDEVNNTFCIVPIPEDIDLQIDIEKIDRNANNTYTVANINQVDMVSKYLASYKENIIYNPEEAYNLLDKSYREARFGNIEKFKEYVENNKTTLTQATVSKYKMSKTDDYTQYTILDQNENYYIFRETAVMEYSVILDTYSIDLPEFIEQYNEGTEQEKVAMNIDKFIQAINAKDYAFAYSKLSDGFKNNYFKTQASFEKYVKENLYEANEISFNNFNNQANIYTYTTIIKDKTTGQTKQQNFVVKLNEGTKFEMSFEI